MDRIETCVSFLIAKAAQQVLRRSREFLADYGVSPTQYAVLKVLWEREGQSGADLTARLAIDSATITGVLDRLQAAGLIERRPHPADRRIQVLFPTDCGRGLQAPLDAAMDRMNAEIAGEMGERADALWAALRRLGEIKIPREAGQGKEYVRHQDRHRRA